VLISTPYYLLRNKLNVDGWIILKLMLQKWSERICIGFISFKTGYSGELLKNNNETSGSMQSENFFVV